MSLRFELTPLGTGAALPATGRYPSAQILNVREELYLIDCGEGTQERLRRYGFNFQRIQHVFISHLHGDHYLGLMGLISTMHLLGRKREMHVHGPADLKAIIEIQLHASQTYLRYPLTFHHVPEQSGALILDDAYVRVQVLLLKHRIPCTGFLFREQEHARKLKKDAVMRVPRFMRDAVKRGADLTLPDGTCIPNVELTDDPPRPRVYAYCSDTAYSQDLIPHIRHADLLYHEATFTEHLAARAKETMHSTALQAATLAKEAEVRALVLGHFSSRYKDVEVLLAEARTVFPGVIASKEGEAVRIEHGPQ